MPKSAYLYIQMKNTDLKRLRDEAIYAVYLQGLSSGAFTSTGEALRYIMRQEAPQFFIEGRAISSYIGMVKNRFSLVNLNSASRRRVWCLYDRYQEWRKEHPDSKLSRERVCEILVEEPAPEFFLKDNAIRHIIYKQSKLRQQKLIDKFSR